MEDKCDCQTIKLDKCICKSGLVARARREMERAGLFDKDADYGGALAIGVLNLLKLLASEGHSGGSLYMTLDIFDKLAKGKTLTPITSDSIEWDDVSSYCGPHQKLWQNNRNSSIFQIMLENMG